MAKKKNEQPEAPKPDNTSVERDGGFYFSAWGIHVVANSEKDAKRVIKESYGVNVDKDPPPPAEHVQEGAKEES